MRAWAMTVQIRAAPDQRFEFPSLKLREQAVEAINMRLEAYRASQRTMSANRSDGASISTSKNGLPHPILPSNGQTASSTATSPSSAAGIYTEDNEDLSPDLQPTKNTELSSLNSQQEISYQKALAQTSTTATLPAAAIGIIGAIVNLPSGSRHKVSPRHFVCMTIGSRGDVQPYSE